MTLDTHIRFPLAPGKGHRLCAWRMNDTRKVSSGEFLRSPFPLVAKSYLSRGANPRCDLRHSHAVGQITIFEKKFFLFLLFLRPLLLVSRIFCQSKTPQGRILSSDCMRTGQAPFVISNPPIGFLLEGHLLRSSFLRLGCCQLHRIDHHSAL